MDARVPEMNRLTPPEDEATDDISWQALLVTAQKAMAEGREERIQPSSIRRMEGQPRVYFNEDSIGRLAASMASIGQIVPGIVRPVPLDGEVQFELLDGERRWRAAQRAQMTYRAIVVDIDDNVAPYIIAAVANFNREGHTPTEVSDTVAQMRRMNIPMPEIAKVLGVSVFWATQMHSLQNLNEQVREMLDPNLPKGNKLAVTAAIQISKMDQTLQTEVANRVLRGSLSLKRLRNEAVRISHAAGKPIRERAREPRKVFESVARMIGSVESLTKHALADMQDKGFEGAFRHKNVYLQNSLLNGLETAKAQIAEAESILRRMRSK